MQLEQDRAFYRSMDDFALVAAVLQLVAGAQFGAIVFLGGDMRGGVDAATGRSIAVNRPELTVWHLVTATLIVALATVSLARLLKVRVDAIFANLARRLSGKPGARYTRRQDEARILETIQHIMPDFRPASLRVAEIRHMITAVRGRRLLMGLDHYIQLQALARHYLDGIDVNEAEARTEHLRISLRHEYYHTQTGEHRLAWVYATATFISAVLFGVVLAVAAASLTRTELGVALMPAVAVSAAGLAFWASNRAADLEVWNELRAEKFAATPSSEFDPADDDADRDPVLDRSYPASSEFAAYLETGFTARSRRALVALLWFAAAGAGVQSGLDLLSTGASATVLVLVLQVAILALAARLGWLLAKLERPPASGWGILRLIISALSPALIFAFLAPAKAFPYLGFTWAIALGLAALGPFILKSLSSGLTPPSLSRGEPRKLNAITLTRLHEFGRYGALLLAGFLTSVFLFFPLDPQFGVETTGRGAALLGVFVICLSASWLAPMWRWPIWIEALALSALAFTVAGVVAAIGVYIHLTGEQTGPAADANQALEIASALRYRLVGVMVAIRYDPEITNLFWLRTAFSATTMLIPIVAVAYLRTRHVGRLQKLLGDQ